MKFFIALISISTLAMVILAGQNSSAAKSPVVASINERKISLKEFNKRYDEVIQQTFNPPTRPQFLEDLIRYEVGVQEAKRLGIQNDPFVQEKINQEIYKFYVDKQISKEIEKIKITESEMKKYYKKNPELKTSHILIEFQPGASEKQIAAARERADEIYKKVKSSKRPFNELVNLFSDDSLSKRNGGDVGWQNRMTLVPAYYDVANKMKVGQIRGLVKTQFGFHIIKLTGRQPYKKANKQMIRNLVFDQRRKVIFDKLFKNLKKKYKISSNKNVIKK